MFFSKREFMSDPSAESSDIFSDVRQNVQCGVVWYYGYRDGTMVRYVAIP